MHSYYYLRHVCLHASLITLTKPSNTYFVCMIDTKYYIYFNMFSFNNNRSLLSPANDYLSNFVAQVVICLQQNIKIE